jgi:hypothetical protein
MIIMATDVRQRAAPRIWRLGYPSIGGCGLHNSRCERAEGRFKVIHAAYNAAYDMQQVQSRIPFA